MARIMVIATRKQYLLNMRFQSLGSLDLSKKIYYNFINYFFAEYLTEIALGNYLYY